MLYGLTGYAGSGKDTAADYLVAKHGFVRVSFADKLREFCLEIDPWIQLPRAHRDSELVCDRLSNLIREYGWDSAKREYMEVREFLQSVGHGARVIFDDLFWIERALTPKVLSNDRIVVTDVRYANEVEYILGLDGFIIRIDRDGVGPVNDHITEKPLPYDYKVNNPVDYIPGLYSNLDDLVRNISRIS